MPGITVSRGVTSSRLRLLVCALAGALVLFVLAAISAAPAAHASGCNTWTKTSGGNWSEGADWSAGHAPTSEEEACITEPGTYTVTMTGLEVTVAKLTVGAASGTQTLQVGSSCSVNAVLKATNGTTVGSQGVLVMTNGDGCGNNVTLVGSIANSGTITSVKPHGGSRSLQGNLTNKGTLAIETPTSFNGGTTILLNEGQVNVSNGVSLSVTSTNSVNNGAGGKIAGGESGNVSIGSGGGFTEGAGTTSGTLPVILDDAALSYEESGGESTIAIRGESSTVNGTSSAKQTLLVQSTCGEHAKLTAASGFVNGGAIELTNGDGCPNNATLTTPVGTLTNSGSISSEVANGGQRVLVGTIRNTGTINVRRNSEYNGGGTLTNEGQINVSEKVSLTVSEKNSVTNAAGNIATATEGVVLLAHASFSEGAGTTTGTLPVIIDDGPLTYTGSGASTIAQEGESSTVSGNLAAGQALRIQSTCGEHAKVTASASLSSAGAITLTNGDNCGNNATLVISGGALTSTGTIAVEFPHGGSRAIQGSVVNRGTITTAGELAYNGASAVLTNEGHIDIAENHSIVVSNKASVINGTGGDISGTGNGNMSVEPESAFTEGAGTTSGTLPVYVRDGVLKYTGGGESTIALRGESSTLSGSPVAKQSLSVQSTCGENAKLTLPSSVTNGGAITLTNGDNCGNNATLVVAEGATLTNSGTIATEEPHGGARNLIGNITNTGTISIGTNTSAANTTAATLLNEGQLDIATGVSLSVSGPTTVTNEAGTIAATGSGVLVQSKGSFNQGAGKETGTLPVALDNTALAYTGKGAGTIGVRGESSTLSGTINAGQKLEIQSTCSEHARLTTIAFTNSGTIVLTNGDNCGNNATLNLAGGTLLNKGTVEALVPHGGARTIEGSVTNEKSVIAMSIVLHVSGSFTQPKKGTLTIGITNSGTFGSIAAAGAASIAGNLALKVTKGFLASVGQKYAILGGSSLSGTFAKETGDVVKGKGVPVGVYYDPTYSSTTVTLVVTQSLLKAEPVEGPAGTVVKLTGTGLPANDTIKLTFTDAKKVKTTFSPTVATNSAGEFTAEESVPAGAAEGKGSFAATSTLTGVVPTAAFGVT